MNRLRGFLTVGLGSVCLLITACSSTTHSDRRDITFQPIPDFGRFTDGPPEDRSLYDGLSKAELGLHDSLSTVDAPIGDAAFPNNFTDVLSSHPYYSEISWCTEKQLIAGCQVTPAKFCPDDPISRSSLVVSLIKLKFGTDFSYTKSPPYFNDVKNTDWQFRYIQKAVDEKIAAGMEPGLFYPDKAATRAAGATILAKAKWGEACTPPNIAQFSDVPPTHWASCYILKLKEANIALACKTTNFCPDDPMTRGVWAAYLYRSDPL